MQETLITFETAKLAKEKGFFNSNTSWYTNKQVLVSIQDFLNCKDKLLYSAPTQSLLQKWLREVHNIHIAILPKMLPSNEIKYYAFKGKIKKDFNDLYNSYEEALEVELHKALTLIPKKDEHVSV